MLRNFASCAQELWVLEIQAKDLTKRLMCINTDTVVGKTLLHDVRPKDRVIQSDGSISSGKEFGAFREWWKAFDTKYPTEPEKQQILAALTVRHAGSKETATSSRGRHKKASTAHAD